jgi:hypothetical protein
MTNEVAAAQVRCVAILAALDTAELIEVLSQSAVVPSLLDDLSPRWATAWTALVESVARWTRQEHVTSLPLTEDDVGFASAIADLLFADILRGGRT